jgi:molybdopterin-containing oxidoreductase family iron-sulfur binding subunit
MSAIDRRDFLKILGLATTATTFGCSRETGRKLIPYVIPAVDIIPGEATYYATTCRECPAGCGVLAKNRDGRVIKLEGNPNHPINRGALCARGQAALHGLYNPDRYPGPRRRNGNTLTAITWEDGLKNLADLMRDIRARNAGGRVAFLTGLENGSLATLTDRWLATFGAGPHLTYEPFAYEPLRVANRIVYGTEGVPAYRIDRADFLLSLNAGFLETWLSNIEYAHQFAAFHAPEGERKNFFVHVGPRQSLTAASADFRIEIPPDREWLVGLALLEALAVEVGRCSELQLPPELGLPLARILTESEAACQAGRELIPAESLAGLARRFLAAERPLVLAAGLPHHGPHATQAAVVANLLNLIKPGSRELIDPAPGGALSGTAPAAEIHKLIERMRAGEIELLLLHAANPLFSLPASWEIAAALAKVKTIVTFSSCPDETSRFAHLVLPTHTYLESWGDYSPRSGITGLIQPVMGPIFDTQPLGDILLATADLAGQGESLPWDDFYQYLRQHWQGTNPTEGFPAYWNERVKGGGAWPETGLAPRKAALAADFAYRFPAPPAAAGSKSYPLTIYPTIQFFDGRGANRPWLQELPDPVTQTTWGGWLEIHPDTAARLKVNKGDLLKLVSPHGEITVPVLPIYSVAPDTLALPIGQGHEHYGRFAADQPANPLALMPAGIDALSGSLTVLTEVKLAVVEGSREIANTDGSFFQEGRDLVEEEPFADYLKARGAKRPASVDLPLPAGYEPHRDIYPVHEHQEYRWCMVIDLDRCIGCGACVVACYAENNVAIVGRQQILRGREMSWLRIQRYFSEKAPHQIRHLPMLCQHCDEAPCEAVCPVFAPHHSVDGLNNQVYNRCFGTRFCSQNDPYKVRRFNWFTFTRDSPLEMQLNPDVTVRQKGVMEKCSFCVQRIVAAKIDCKSKGRKVKDGDFTTACAQTCPAGALTVGNLLDPESRVAKMVKDPRAYQVLRELNTKPAMIYLRRLTQEL